MFFILRGFLLFLATSLIVCASGRSIDSAVNTDPGDTEDDLMCSVSGCHYDLNLFCLSNGVIVMGTCSLKNVLCTNGERNEVYIADSWDTCFGATYNVPHDQMIVHVVHNNRQTNTGASSSAHTAAQNTAASADAAGSDNEPAVGAQAQLPSKTLMTGVQGQQNSPNVVERTQGQTSKSPKHEGATLTTKTAASKNNDAEVTAIEEELVNILARAHERGNNRLHSAKPDSEPTGSGEDISKGSL